MSEVVEYYDTIIIAKLAAVTHKYTLTHDNEYIDSIIMRFIPSIKIIYFHYLMLSLK